jgi:hypothetical protein
MKKLFLVIAPYLILTVFTNCTAPSSSSYSDSSKVDTATVDTTSKNPSISVEDSKKADALKTLNEFDTDKSTFDKLYANAKKKGDEFSSLIVIRDITSPNYVNRMGFIAKLKKRKMM